MKKFVCVMLTLLLCVSLLAACGGDNADSGVTDSAAPEKAQRPKKATRLKLTTLQNQLRMIGRTRSGT